MNLAVVFFAVAADAPMLVQPGKVISAPDLKSPLGPEWSIAKGKWESADGVLTATEIPAEHHSAVLHLKTGPAPLVFECEFRFGTASPRKERQATPHTLGQIHAKNEFKLYPHGYYEIEEQLADAYMLKSFRKAKPALRVRGKQ